MDALHATMWDMLTMRKDLAWAEAKSVARQAEGCSVGIGERRVAPLPLRAGIQSECLCSCTCSLCCQLHSNLSQICLQEARDAAAWHGRNTEWQHSTWQTCKEPTGFLVVRPEMAEV